MQSQSRTEYIFQKPIVLTLPKKRIFDITFPRNLKKKICIIFNLPLRKRKNTVVKDRAENMLSIQKEISIPLYILEHIAILWN